MSLPFNRFKKKSLLLITIILPEEFDILKEIKHKKLYKCTLKEDLGLIFDEICLYGHTYPVHQIIKLSKTQIVSAGVDSSIKVWDLSTGNCLKTLNGHSQTITLITKISLTQIVSCSYDKSIKFWDIPSENV